MIRLREPLATAALEALESRRLLHAPVVASVPDYTVPVGNTLQIPLTATYDHSDKLVWSSSDNSSAITTGFRKSTNTFIEMQVQGYADPMVFQLFDDVAPETVRRIKGLVQAGFYDGLTFHRVINNFVLQGGDPAGTGSGDVGYKFDDEFNPGVSFTGDGQLAMANSGKDTNGSQFFITEGAARFLDFNHTVFGQLVRGFATRNAISDVSVDSQSRPASTVRITRVRIIGNTTDAVLQVKINGVGSGTITVMATGKDGTHTRSFKLTGVADTINDPPVLTSLTPVYYTNANTPININIKGSDVEGDAIEYGAQVLDGTGLDLQKSQINNQTGAMTLVPKAGFVGKITLYIGVKAPGATMRGSTQADSSAPLSGIYDSQLITVAVGEQPISTRTVSLNTVSGAAATLPVATFTDADSRGVAGNFSAKINWGDGGVTTGTVRKEGSRFVVYGTHTYAAKVSEGSYPITVDITGNLGAIGQAKSTAYVRPFASVNNGVLLVHGTTAADRVGVGIKGSNYVVTVNGTTRAFATSTVTGGLQIFGYESGDLLQIAETGVQGGYIDGGDGNDHLYGGAGHDTINCGAGNDTVFARAGYDRVAGGAGNDTISGGDHKDRLFGQDGNDYIWGDAAPDFIYGGAGNDTLIGGTSNDSIWGEAGDDIINGLNGADVLDGGTGRDTTKLDNKDTRVAIEVLV